MNDNSTPLVSVVLPVFNGEKYLAEAFDSLLNQTMGDFEVLIVDDGSTDSTPSIIGDYCTRDRRIRRLTNSRNQGITFSLNRGLTEARGEFIARMDADDVCHPTRFEKQVDFLRRHKNIGLLGTEMYNLSQDGFLSRSWSFTRHAELAWFLLFTCTFGHPTVMFRRSLIELFEPFYRDVTACEDYELWVRLSRVTQLANLPVPLLTYRLHEERISVREDTSQRNNANSLSHREIRALFPKEKCYSDEEVEKIRGSIAHTPKGLAEIKAAHDYLDMLTPFSIRENIDIALFEGQVRATLLKNLIRTVRWTDPEVWYPAVRLMVRCIREEPKSLYYLALDLRRVFLRISSIVILNFDYILSRIRLRSLKLFCRRNESDRV